MKKVPLKISRLLDSSTPEGEKQLDDMIEAATAAKNSTKVEASHTATRELMVSMGSSYTGNSKAFHDIIRECQKVYFSTPIVRNIIDLMTDFASEGLSIVHKIESTQKFFNNWAVKSGFSRIIPAIFHTIFLTGNCIVLKQYGRITPTTKKDLSKAYLENEKPRSRVIPVGYTILNPLRIEIESNEIFDEKVIYYTLTERDAKRLSEPKSAKDIEFINSLPREFVQDAIASKKIKLDNSKITILHYKKLEWQEWAFPLIFSAIDDVNYKKLLRQMDEASANDVIKAIVVFKLGKTIEGLPPDSARFSKLSTLLKQATGGKTIVWDDLIEIISNYPPIDKILGKEKYTVVDRDILSNFGVSEILITGGGGGSFSAGFLSVRALQEKLESARGDITDKFTTPELEFVQEALGFPTAPYTRFSSMSLRDEVAEKKLVMDMVDRKIISPDTLVEEFEYNPEIEKTRMSRVEKNYPDILSPFDQKSMPTGGQPGQGRPKNTMNIPQKVERNTEPQGLSLGMLNRIHQRIYSKVMHEFGSVTGREADIISMSILALQSIDSNLNNLTDEIIEQAATTTLGNIPIQDTIYAKVRDCIQEEKFLTDKLIGRICSAWEEVNG